MHALNALRLAAMRCRARARVDLFNACALLANERAVAAPAYAEALLRTLEQGLSKRPTFYVPGSIDVSFDERWLMTLIFAFRANDLDSAAFLIARRIAPQARRSVGFLAAGVARELETL